MVQSSEFIKGYTEIVVCALLFERDDYLYSLVKRITDASPSAAEGRSGSPILPFSW